MKKKITNIMTTCSSDSLANTGLNYISPPTAHSHNPSLAYTRGAEILRAEYY